MKLRDDHELRWAIAGIIEAADCGDTAHKVAGLILDAIDRRTPAAPPELTQPARCMESWCGVVIPHSHGSAPPRQRYCCDIFAAGKGHRAGCPAATPGTAPAPPSEPKP